MSQGASSSQQTPVAAAEELEPSKLLLFKLKLF